MQPKKDATDITVKLAYRVLCEKKSNKNEKYHLENTVVHLMRTGQ